MKDNLIYNTMMNNSIIILTKEDTRIYENMAKILKKDLTIIDYTKEDTIHSIFYGDLDCIFNKFKNLLKYDIKDYEIQDSKYVLEKSFTLLKLLYNNLESISYKKLYELISNNVGNGRKIVMEFKKKNFETLEDLQLRDSIVNWFLNIYYVSLDKIDSSLYLNTKSLRYFLEKLNKEYITITNFSSLDHLKENQVIICKFNNSNKCKAIFNLYCSDFKYYQKNNTSMNTFYFYVQGKGLFINREYLSKKELIPFQVNLQTLEDEEDVSIEKKIGKQIKEIRELHNLNQEDFAKKLDVSKNFISDVERGIKCLSLPKLIEFCQLFDVSMDKFLL